MKQRDPFWWNVGPFFMVVILVILSLWFVNLGRQACRKAGGIYFSHDALCVKDGREIQP